MQSFSPTQAELGLVNRVFALADPQKVGIITGDAAVKIFAGSKLPSTVLGEVWAIADKDNNGFLTKTGTAIAIRLIAHAQKGEVVKEALLDNVCPPAHIEGLPQDSSASQSIPLSPPTSPLPGGGHLPPLTEEDKAKFLRLFVGCGPVNRLLSGEKARDVFIKSKLSVEKLSQIWFLADTQDRGSLDQTDFTIAMYLIQATMSGQITALPASLPQWLHEQASGNSHSNIQTHTTGNSTHIAPSLTGSFPASTLSTEQNTGTARSRLQQQATGQERRRTSFAASTYALSNNSATLGSSAFNGSPWDVTPEEKNRYDSLFDKLDSQKRAFIGGDVAVPFMLESKLSEDILAQVWDLADINKDGRLTRDGFAVAMHLIEGRLIGKVIPPMLPISLIPPSMRVQNIPKEISTPATNSVPGPMPDLLWEDSPPVSATFAKPTSPFALSTSNSQPAAIVQPQSTGQFSHRKNDVASTGLAFTDPFASGAAMSPHSNGVQRDLLDDDDDVTTNVVLDNSAEIGNTRNQISSTTRSLEATKAERQSIEANISSQASQLSSLQTQLASAKAAYETETRLLNTLRERFSKQSIDIQKAQEELIRAESDLSAIRVEKAEIEGNLLRDKEEVRDLQRRMKEVGDEIESLKRNIEKAKKETKHQKGLLAIAKKQLAAKEAERTKATKELGQAESDLKEVKEEMNAVDAMLHEDLRTVDIDSSHSASLDPVPRDTDTPSRAAKYPLPSSPLSSPASIGSTTSLTGNTASNNPFERLIVTISRPSSPTKEHVTDDALALSPITQTVGQGETDASTAAKGNEKLASVDDVPPVISSLDFITDSFTTMPESTSKSVLSNVTNNPFGPSQEVPSADERLITGTGAEADISAVDKEEAEIVKTASRFPEIITDSTKQPESRTFDNQTDLGQDLLEKEAEESDSDGENDGEVIFHDAKESRQSIISPVEDAAEDSGSAFKDVTDMFPKEVEPKVQSLVPSTTFDDAFGLDVVLPGVVDQQEQKPVRNAFSSNLFSLPTQSADKEIDSNKEDTNINTTSGVSAFDEALGKIPSPNAGSSSHFRLDSGFEDDFNFTAAKAQLDNEFTQLQPSHFAADMNGSLGSQKSPFTVMSVAPVLTSTSKTDQVATVSFDDIYGKVNAAQPDIKQAAGDMTRLFDNAFEFTSPRALSHDTGGSLDAIPRDLPDIQELGTSRKQSSPRSSIVIPTTTSPTTIRPASPPLRTNSPRPRVSTGSSNEGSVHAKPAPPQRHTKLSIRLPFRRRKHEQTQPPPAQLPPSRPPPSQPPPSLPPSLPTLSEPNTPFFRTDSDDFEPVKQLCSMGFERQRVLTALEKHGYDMQRALNSLLGNA